MNSLDSPCKAFWKFVHFVDYKGEQDEELFQRIADKYTFSEIQMFKGMYYYYSNILSKKLGSDVDD
jgi:hypothetical protein